MSSRVDRGGEGGRGKVFLSAHRCPEVDVLPYHNSEARMPQQCSPVPAEKSPEFTSTGRSEADYLDISSTCCSEEEEEAEGIISDWSEEDLSLHFSPSVILPSDDEESDTESSFKCIEVTVETQVMGQEVKGLKMVPKRQIQLKKKKDTENIIDQEKTQKPQVIKRDSLPGGANSELAPNELLCPIVHHRPDQLLRQHSMPASFHTHSTTSSDVNSYRVYRGMVAGASQGFQAVGNSDTPRRLQKSFSLDETKTKMASCIIKSVLSKKMQVEQSNTKTLHPMKKPEALPVLPPAAEQQRVKEGVGTGGGVFKAPVHVVRDVRSLVKNTYSLSFSTATPPEIHKPTSFKVIGQDGSPPPSYQQAVGVKGHHKSKTNCSRGHVAKVAASLSQTYDRKQRDTLSPQITQQRRGSEPIISRRKVDDVTLPVKLLGPPSPTTPTVKHSEKARGASCPTGTSIHHSVSIQPPPPPPSAPRHPQGTQSSLSAQEQGSFLSLTSQSALCSSQQVLHSHFYTPPTMPPHTGDVSYVHSPLNYIQTQLQPPPPAPALHLLRRSEGNQDKTTGKTSDLPNYLSKTFPPQQIGTTGDQEGHGNTGTPAAQKQQQQQEQHHPQQQPFLCSVQSFLPAQVSSDFVVDITGSAVPPGALLSGPAPCHMMLEPKSGRCYLVDTPQQPQRKMLLDPETGQFIQVFLPAASSAPNTTVFPVCCANPAPAAINPAPTMLQVANANPTVLSVMRLQPTVAFPSLYAPPCLPFTLHTPPGNFTHTAP